MSVKALFPAIFPPFSVEILTAPLQIGTDNTGFSAQFPTKKGPGNLTPNEGYSLGPAKTYILRGTPRTCAIKTRAVTDN